MAVGCEPPDNSGRPITQWTNEELRDEVIRREIVDDISASQVGRYLREAQLQSHLHKMWVNTKAPSHRIRFVYLPKHSSWLNQIEVIFGIVMRKLLRRGSFTSVEVWKTGFGSPSITSTARWRIRSTGHTPAARSRNRPAVNTVPPPSPPTREESHSRRTRPLMRHYLCSAAMDCRPSGQACRNAHPRGPASSRR